MANKVLIPSSDDDVQPLAEAARQLLTDIEVVVFPVDGADPAPSVVEAVAREEAHLVAAWSRGYRRSPWRFASSLAEDVLRDSPVPVLRLDPACSPRGGAPRRILLPHDGSAAADAVLPVAARLARDHGAEVVLLQVEDVPGMLSEWPPHLEDLDTAYALRWILEDCRYPERALASLMPRRDSLMREGVRVSLEPALGSVGEEIVRRAQDADLVLMASNGTSGRWSEGCLGSIVKYVMRRATTPVLVVPVAPGVAAPLAA